MNNVLKDNVIKVKQHKVELIKKEQLVKDLRLCTDQVCIEYDVLKNRSAHIEVRHKLLIEQSKDELCRVILVNQEEDYFEVK